MLATGVAAPDLAPVHQSISKLSFWIYPREVQSVPCDGEVCRDAIVRCDSLLFALCRP
ncbi:hypothetical protein BDV32DRAFT_124587 [Aspergillus pseudonomiae]|nr:hypothetical protein BDV32DRAFT_124587 [Aspergillus pseudonomiae]